MALELFIRHWAFFFQFNDSIHNRYDSLDGGSARRKATTHTQKKTIYTRKHPYNEWDSKPQRAANVLADFIILLWRTVQGNVKELEKKSQSKSKAILGGL
jgi:hypothetical protein